MATRPSSLTLFDRATPEQRAEIRRKSLALPCPDCKARAHETCRGVNGKPAKPHYARQVNGGARPVPVVPPAPSAFESFVEARGVDHACRGCGGLGTKLYGSTTTWRGGVGGAAMTSGVCDQCWGSGDATRPWPSHRTMEATRDHLKAVTGRECDRLAEDMDDRSKDHSAWWKKVERARKFLQPPPKPAAFPSKCSACGEQSHFGRCIKKGGAK